MTKDKQFVHGGYARNVGRPYAGADPELFVVTPKRKHPRAASRWFELETTKSAEGRGGKIIRDNVLVELQPYPAGCLSWTQDSLGSLIQEAARIVKRDNMKLHVKPVMRVAKAEIAKGGMEFGCSPAFRLMDGNIEQVIPHTPADRTQYRSAGYHVHLGCATPTRKNSKLKVPSKIPFTKPPSTNDILFNRNGLHLPLTQMMDSIVGLFGTIMECYLGWENECRIRRHEIGYGMAGEFRPQPHGYEYRVLSPWPLLHPTLMHLVHYMARDCTYPFQFALEDMVLSSVDYEEVQQAINTSDGTLAQDLLRKVLVAWTEAAEYRIEETSKLTANFYLRSKDAKVHGWYTGGAAVNHRVLGGFLGWLAKGELFDTLWDFWGRTPRKREPKKFPALWTFASHKFGCESFMTANPCEVDPWLKGMNITTSETVPCSD